MPEVPEPALYGSMREAVEELREWAEANSRRYIEGVAKQLQEPGVNARSMVVGSRPATAILEVAEGEHVDVIMLATHGRGGWTAGPGQRGRPGRASRDVPGVFGAGARKKGRVVHCFVSWSRGFSRVFAQNPAKARLG